MPLPDRIAVYTGKQMDCVNLQLTLAGNGIVVELEPRIGGGHGVAAVLFVKRSDVEQASLIIEACRRKSQGSGIGDQG